MNGTVRVHVVLENGTKIEALVRNGTDAPEAIEAAKSLCPDWQELTVTVKREADGN